MVLRGPTTSPQLCPQCSGPMAQGVLLVRALPLLVAPSGPFLSSPQGAALLMLLPDTITQKHQKNIFLKRKWLFLTISYYFKTFQSDPNSSLNKEHCTKKVIFKVFSSLYIKKKAQIKCCVGTKNRHSQAPKAKLIKWTQSSHSK